MADGSPRKKSQKRLRNHRVTTFLTDEENELFLEQLEASGLSRGGFLRKCIFGDAGPRTQHQPNAQKKLLGRLLGELGKIGSNLSQLARHDPDLPSLEDTILAISDMRACVAVVIKQRTQLQAEAIEQVTTSLGLSGHVINEQAFLANRDGAHAVSVEFLTTALNAVFDLQADVMVALGEPLKNALKPKG